MRISPTVEIIVYITMGSPAGIGPEVIVKAIENLELAHAASCIILGDKRIFEEQLSEQQAKKNIHFLKKRDLTYHHKPGIYLLDPREELRAISSKSAFEGEKKAKICIDEALNLMRDLPSEIEPALVTAPVSKFHLSQIVPGFTGHTEYLRDFYSKKHVEMLMVGKSLKVLPMTRHIPLADVPGSITEERLNSLLNTLISERNVIMEKQDPVIGLCGLNPHAGENGNIGEEENKVIRPVIERCKKRSYSYLHGPLPADTAFYKAFKGELDIVVGMYHDQCLGPFKMLEFDRGVNMTLGLDHIRTSPVHGTAFDIAGTGSASCGSMINAIDIAYKSALRKKARCL